MDAVTPPIAVTGSTGAIGGQVARFLEAERRPLRLVVRSPERAPKLAESMVVASGYGDADAATRALEGVELLFMVSAAESADRLAQHRTFIDAAQRAGVRHVVYTSFQGAAPDATFTLARDHFATEQHLAASGMDWTILRDSFYIDFLPALVGDDGVIRGPAGRGRVAAVTRSDVARAASAVLLDPVPHRNTVYDLTGPEALTLDEVAAILSDRGGRTVTFHHETIDEAYASRARWGAPAWQNDAWVSTYLAIAAGEVAQVGTGVETLTGRRPATLSEYLARQGAGTR